MKAAITNNYILRLAAPIALAMFIPVINDLTNNFFIGHTGVRELAVIGLTSVFYLVFSMVGYGLSNGVQVKLSRHAANLDYTGISRIFTNGILLALLLSLLLMLLAIWLAPVIFELALHSKERVVLSIDYLYVRIWGLPFLMLTQLANAFFISIARSKYLLIGSLAATITNILLDYMLIFGHWGFPQMGLQGAAIASVGAEIGAATVMFSAFYLFRLYRQFPLHHYFLPDLKLITGILKISAPLIFQYVFSITGWLVFFFYVEQLGERELAASQLIRTVFRIVSIMAWACGATCNTMVSNIIGQGRKGEVVKLVHKICRISFLATSAICVVMVLGARYYLSIFTQDEALIELAIPCLRVVAVATLVMSLCTVVFNGVVGTGRTTVNMVIEVSCVCGYLLYCYLVIERMRSPLYIAWMAEFTYWISMLGLSYLYLRSGRWRIKQTA